VSDAARTPTSMRAGLIASAASRPVPRLVEEGALVLLAAAATVYAEAPALFRAFSFQGDAMVHLYWMRRFRDPALFHDPLTNALVDTGYVPVGVQWFYHAAAQLVDPVKLGEWLPVVLAPLAAWLVFRIVREHTVWWPGAWLGALLFLFPWDVQRFSGGLPRAFGQPIVLLTLLFVLRRRERLAAAVPPVGALLYPPAAVAGVATLAFSALRFRARRPALDRVRAVHATASAAVTGAALLAPRVLGLSHSHLISADVARQYPEFGARGQMDFFRDSVIAMLRANYSGFGLQKGGSVLAVAAILLLIVRPANARLVRAEVWALAVASLALFGLSYAFLFRLYLPQRYTEPLVPVFCIVIAVSWRPTWEALARRVGATTALVAALAAVPAIALAALVLFPLGPRQSAPEVWDLLAGAPATLAVALAAALATCAAIGLRRDARGAAPAAALIAVLAGALLVAEVQAAGGGQSPALNRCQDNLSMLRYVATLPKTAIIAGDPVEISCVPIASERSVMISEKLYQVYDYNFLRFARPRMFTMIRAYYGPSERAIVNLHRRLGVDYLVVQEALFDPPNRRMDWFGRQPFVKLVARLRRRVDRPAALHLPPGCRTWRHGGTSVYDLNCVTQSVRAAG
jgi:hypothetical protein